MTVRSGLKSYQQTALAPELTILNRSYYFINQFITIIIVNSINLLSLKSCIYVYSKKKINLYSRTGVMWGLAKNLIIFKKMGTFSDREKPSPMDARCIGKAKKREPTSLREGDLLFLRHCHLF